MAKVSLHVYDVTNSPNPKTNNAILQINRYARDTFGLGGVFHGAVEVYGEEWSFGYCERGPGVFSCPPKANPMYTYRETIELGVTPLDEKRVNQLLLEMSTDWAGRTYDLLARNCNHFCDEFCQRLGAGPIPLWVNRFANFGDAALEFYDQTSEQIQILREYVYSTSRNIYSFFAGSPTAVITEGQRESIPSEVGLVFDRSYAVPVRNDLNSSSRSMLLDDQRLENRPAGSSLVKKGSSERLASALSMDSETEKKRTSLPVCPTIPVGSSRGF